MKIEMQTYGLLAKNKGKKTVQISKEKPTRPICPSCGETLKEGAIRCEICGANMGDAPSGGAVPSRLSDEELGAKLRSLAGKVKLVRVLAVIGAVVVLITGSMQAWVVFAIVLLFTCACSIYSVLANHEMKIFVSANMVRDALAEVFELTEYKADNHLARELVEASDLISGWNECSGSDYASGKYRGVRFEFSDMDLDDVETRTDDEGNESEHRTNRFKGQWLILECEKQLEKRVRVRERAERKIRGGYEKSKTDVETENPAFNEKFEILAEDPHTAFYVLTPHFMEYILSADQRADGRTYLCFKNNRVHIAVHTNRDSFEIGSGAELKNIPALRERIKGETRYITMIIDELLQNEYLFGKVN